MNNSQGAPVSRSKFAVSTYAVVNVTPTGQRFRWAQFVNYEEARTFRRTQIREDKVQPGRVLKIVRVKKKAS